MMNCIEYMQRLYDGKLLVLDPDYNLNEPYSPGNFRLKSIESNTENLVDTETLRYYAKILSFQ